MSKIISAKFLIIIEDERIATEGVSNTSTYKYIMNVRKPLLVICSLKVFFLCEYVSF
jgi:hypothetical protein